MLDLPMSHPQPLPISCPDRHGADLTGQLQPMQWRRSTGTMDWNCLQCQSHCFSADMGVPIGTPMLALSAQCRHTVSKCLLKSTWNTVEYCLRRYSNLCSRCHFFWNVCRTSSPVLTLAKVSFMSQHHLWCNAPFMGSRMASSLNVHPAQLRTLGAVVF